MGITMQFPKPKVKMEKKITQSKKPTADCPETHWELSDF